MTDRVKLSVSDGVAEVLLNRPERMNALDMAMLEALVSTAQLLRQMPNIRAVVLAGTGPAFCAGLDTSLFMAGELLVDLTVRTHGITNLFQQAAWAWHELPVPVIAAVQGVVFGGGLQIMMGADIRYADTQAQFSVMELDWGIVPDMGGSQLYRQCVRDDILRELTFSARRFNAQEASEYGFITRVLENPREEALRLARSIAAKNPHAVRAAKHLCNEGLHLSSAEGLLLESVLQQRLLGSANQLEAIAAKRDNRPPQFSDPIDGFY